MCSCIKDLYDYELVTKCCRCKKILLNLISKKIKKKNDGLFPQCNFCVKKYYIDNQDRLLYKQKLYDKRNRDKINTRLKEYFRKRRDSDLDFNTACF